MTQETYENLMQVIQKRIRQSRITGNWTEHTNAIEAKTNLIMEFNNGRNIKIMD
jgi:hypothetical protein